MSTKPPLQLRLVDVRAPSVAGVPVALRAAILAALDGTGLDIEFSEHEVEHDPQERPALDLAQLQALAAAATSRPQAADASLVIARVGDVSDGLRGTMLGGLQHDPRRAAVVFATDAEVKNLAPGFVRTCLHELGHLLNLVHPFELQVNQPDSASCMNYPDIFAATQPANPGARLLPAYSEVELRHLFHGRDADVLPGGTPFHSAPYWRKRSMPLLVPDRPNRDAAFTLKLEPPAAGDTFTLGQPVFLRVAVDRRPRNATAPPWLLDPKASQLEIHVRGPRRSGQRFSEAEPRLFIPVAQRCYESAAGSAKWENNLNLAYGAEGFTFPDAGAYEVRAVVRLLGVSNFDPATKTSQAFDDMVIVSDWLPVEITEPIGLEARDLDLLREPATGVYWALGGSLALVDVATRLDDYLERQQGRGRRARDPISLNALRCKGLDAARRYLRPERHARAGEALRYLEAVLDAACFDAATLQEMADLVAKLRGRQPAALAAPEVATARRPGWNVLLYMAAESRNLREAAEADLRELEAAGPSSGCDDTQVFVQLDTAGPAGARRYQITRQRRTELAPPEPKETNTGDPLTLRRFVATVQGEHPAERTLLVLWGHSQGVGFGLQPGLRLNVPVDSADFGFDVTSDDALTLPELGRALRSNAARPRRPVRALLAETRRLRELTEQRVLGTKTAPAAALPDVHVDILGFDSCFMAGVEVAAELGRSVDYLLAGPASLPLAGWDYRNVLREITTRPRIAPDVLGRRLSKLSVTWPDEPALTFVNLRRRSELLARVGALVEAVQQAARDEGERARLLAAIQAAPFLGAREFLDLRELCRGIERRTRDSQVEWAAARVARYLKPDPERFVEAVAERPGREPGGGISIYCPLVAGGGPNALVDQARYARLGFNRRTGWAELIQSDALRRPPSPRVVPGLPLQPAAGAGGAAPLATQLGLLLLAQLGGDGPALLGRSDGADTTEPKPTPGDRSADPKSSDPSKAFVN